MRLRDNYIKVCVRIQYNLYMLYVVCCMYIRRSTVTTYIQLNVLEVVLEVRYITRSHPKFRGAYLRYFIERYLP